MRRWIARNPRWASCCRTEPAHRAQRNFHVPYHFLGSISCPLCLVAALDLPQVISGRSSHSADQRCRHATRHSDRYYQEYVSIG